MKRMKKLTIVLLAVLTAACTVCGFAACGNEPTPPPSSDISESIIDTHTHDWNETVTKQASCISDGEITYSCYCGELYTIPLKAYGHRTQVYEAKEATCTEFGWFTYEACLNDNCGYTTYTKIEANGHKFEQGKCLICKIDYVGEHEHEWDSGVITTVPTCMGQGIKTYTCWCKDTKTEAVGALGHDKENHAGEDATCTEGGWKAYETCKREGCEYTTYEEISAAGHSYIVGACEVCGFVDSYLTSTKARQAKQKDPNNDKEYEAEFMYAYDIGDIRFLQYRIGEIENCFVQTLMTPIQNIVGLEKILYETTNLTSASISKGISNSISTTKSVSIAESEKETLSWDFTKGTEVSTSTKVGVEVGMVPGEAEVSASINTAYTEGESKENATSTEISNGVVEETNNSFNMQELTEMGQSISFELNMEKMQKGLFYALCLVADVDIYQVIGYNVITGELYTTYFMSCMQSNTAMTVLSSKNASFEVTPEYHISPISEINIELEELKMVSIAFEENGGSEITNVLIRENKSLDEIPVPERKYYTFKGWYTNANFDTSALVVKDTTFEKNTTLYAKWERNTAKVTFDSKGGSAISERVINQGDRYTLPTSSLYMYDLLGWRCNGLLYSAGTSVTVENDMHFVAEWQAKTTLTGTNVYNRTWRLTSPDGKYTWISDDDNVNAKRGLYDAVSIEQFGYSLSTLKEYGFKTITLKIRLDIRERDDGYQEMYIANHYLTAVTNHLWCNTEIVHGGGATVKEIGSFWFNVTLNVADLTDVLYFTYEAHGSGYDSWYNEGLYVEFTASK